MSLQLGKCGESSSLDQYSLHVPSPYFATCIKHWSVTVLPLPMSLCGGCYRGKHFTSFFAHNKPEMPGEEEIRTCSTKRFVHVYYSGRLPWVTGDTPTGDLIQCSICRHWFHQDCKDVEAWKTKTTVVRLYWYPTFILECSVRPRPSKSSATITKVPKWNLSKGFYV